MADKHFSDDLYDSVKRLAIKRLLEDIRKHQEEQGWSDDYAPPPIEMPEGSGVPPSELLPDAFQQAEPAVFNQPDEWERTNPFRKLLSYKL